MGNLNTLTPTFLLGANPDRSQLAVFAQIGMNGANPSVGVYLFHRAQDGTIGPFAFHPHFTLAPNFPPSTSIPVVFTPTLILSYPVHGAIVQQEWWCLGTQGGEEVSMTGYNYLD